MTNAEIVPVYRAALEYVQGGLSVLPIRCDGSKAPALTAWDFLKTRLPSRQELHSWFSPNGVGIAVVAGTASGKLAIMDIEYPDFAALWCELVETECPGLIDQLPQVLTPGKSGQPGKHFYFRAPETVSTQKLAKLSALEADKRTGDKNKTTAIEVKGEGGYCLAPGCPEKCHESGRKYVHVGGPFLEETPVLSADQVAVLLSCARALDNTEPQRTEDYVGRDRCASDVDRPGDVFNRRGDWLDILGPHGWVVARSRGNVLYLRRPGKDKGISATVGYCISDKAGDLLCVFSTNAEPLGIADGRDHQCYSKFAAYALLEHDGNFRAAAKQLAEKGYGFDIGLSAAERFAIEQAEDIKDVNDATAWEDLRQKVARRSVDKAWDLQGDEIDLVVEAAKKNRVTTDPKLLAEEAHRDIDVSFGTPEEPPAATNASAATKMKPWKLIVIESVPPEYLLRAPYWSAQPKVQTQGGFIRLTVKQLAVWTGLRDQALAQADVRLPDKIHGWARILQRLLDRADHQVAPADTRRPHAVLEFLWEKLRSAHDIRVDENGKFRFGPGSPLRLPDGRITVKLTWLLQRGLEHPDVFDKKELVEAMESVGMQVQVHGPKDKRVRLWTATAVDFANLQATLLDHLPHHDLDPAPSEPTDDLDDCSDVESSDSS